MTDGPFAEAKEVLGGYWMIDVKSREEGSNGPSDARLPRTKLSRFARCRTSRISPDVQAAASGLKEMQAQAGQRTRRSGSPRKVALAGC